MYLVCIHGPAQPSPQLICNIFTWEFEDHEFQDSLGYVSRPCLKKNCHRPLKKPCTLQLHILTANPLSLRQPLISVSVEFPLLDISYKWNRNICGPQ
jgi:hypothetical protein